MNFGESRSSKTYKGSEFWSLWIFAPFESWNSPNKQNSKALKGQKMAVLELQEFQNWFHVKSLLQKNPLSFSQIFRQINSLVTYLIIGQIMWF